MYEDTIAAIATAPGEAGIGVIRISGSRAIPIAGKVFVSMNGKRFEEPESHKAVYGMIKDGDTPVDECILLPMLAPHSYTGEDVVEIQCHGGPMALRTILGLLLRHGARAADPGEYTKRAFLNGKLDLSQAEAVMDVIQAKNPFALESSVRQLKGAVHDRLAGLREELLYELAYLESALDDPEHITLDGFGERLAEKSRKWIGTLHDLMEAADNGRIRKEGIGTVIVGKPNAGKSSILNVLLGEDRAIVTDIAGTTRDTLEETLQLRGIMLRVTDTAGIRETDDVVEQLGVERTRECVKTADLVLYVADSSVPTDENDDAIREMIRGKKAVVLLNKSDLPPVSGEEDFPGFPVISVSAKENTGLDGLYEWIMEQFFQGKISCGDEMIITNVRHKNLLAEAGESLERVLEGIQAGMPEDICAIDLMDAYERLGFITGESVGDDLVNEIFSKFCVGK